MNPRCEPTHKDPIITVPGVEKKPWDFKTTLPEDQVEVNRNLRERKGRPPWAPRWRRLEFEGCIFTVR